MKFLLALVSSAALIPAAKVRADSLPNFELRDGDRVVFIGSTFIERDQVYGYLETMLTARWPDRAITFRNLGWSGDNVWGEARARFGTVADGFQHLQEQIEALNPSVIFVGYGGNESFEGEAGLTKFEQGLNTLLDMLDKCAARIVMLSPLRHENLGPPLPDPATRNNDLRVYGELIRKVSDERGLLWIDLSSVIEHSKQSPSFAALTENGIHLSEFGYWKVAAHVMDNLKLSPRPWAIKLGSDGTPSETTGVTVSDFEKRADGIRFEARPDQLPFPARPRPRQRSAGQPRSHGDGLETVGSIDGIPPGNYALRRDGGQLVKLRFSHGPLPVSDYVEQVAELRALIVAKNRLYFHRWRPQNETYLFGFRKHEQGQNAAEVPMFDPLIEELEAKIAKLRVPVKHTYEIIGVGNEWNIEPPMKHGRNTDSESNGK